MQAWDGLLCKQRAELQADIIHGQTVDSSLCNKGEAPMLCQGQKVKQSWCSNNENVQVAMRMCKQQGSKRQGLQAEADCVQQLASGPAQPRYQQTPSGKLPPVL